MLLEVAIPTANYGTYLTYHFCSADLKSAFSCSQVWRFCGREETQRVPEGDVKLYLFLGNEEAGSLRPRGVGKTQCRPWLRPKLRGRSTKTNLLVISQTSLIHFFQLLPDPNPIDGPAPCPRMRSAQGKVNLFSKPLTNWAEELMFCILHGHSVLRSE